jgi:phage terminase large subunit
VAHWNEIRDEWRVEQARLCKVPSEELIRKYEETGNDSYWYEFIELIRADKRRKQQLRSHSSKL